MARLPCITFSKIKMKANGYTLPEILVTMMIGGILLLFLFDGIDMIHGVAKQNKGTDIMSKMNKLEEYELLKEKSDSVFIGDSVRFYMRGIEIGACAIWD